MEADKAPITVLLLLRAGDGVPSNAPATPEGKRPKTGIYNGQTPRVKIAMTARESVYVCVCVCMHVCGCAFVYACYDQ